MKKSDKSIIGYYLSMIIFLMILFFLLSCAHNPDMLEVREDVIMIGGCILNVNRCIGMNCGDLILSCAAEECDPVKLSFCLIKNCTDDVKDCLDDIQKVIEDN